ncbi:c-type cytochrome [Altererythrobacter aerius]|uniref:C-type cytochrome n=1 Tax=Tsuneonella aeria TaxID=1837929 RepID=A0A6I4TFS1_9SPHN|nr:c-type cytochrome [Tsuneonella aeria]MXO74975.1 c-type cytochrome [Tsuneonella aeria]
MDDRFNTAAGWVLFSGVVALGLSSVSAKYFHADRPERPEAMGFPIEGVVEEGAGGEAGPDLGTLLASADAAAGEKAAQGRCGTCHTFDQGGAAKQGPNLWAVMGKPIGKHAAGFAYSSALSGHGGDWTFENMDAWLKSPKAFAPGTKMSFAGLSNAEDRANILLYLKQQGGGPELPAPAAAAAEAPAAGAAEDAAAGDPTAGAGPAEKPGPEAAGAVASPANDGPTKSTVGVQ